MDEYLSLLAVNKHDTRYVLTRVHENGSTSGESTHEPVHSIHRSAACQPSVHVHCHSTSEQQRRNEDSPFTFNQVPKNVTIMHMHMPCMRWYACHACDGCPYTYFRRGLPNFRGKGLNGDRIGRSVCRYHSRFAPHNAPPSHVASHRSGANE